MQFALSERCLTFGSASSPGIYDDLAELILVLTLHILSWRRDTVCRQMDDTIFLGPRAETETWYTTYKGVCKLLNIQVAEEVAAKAFGVTDTGSVLGLILNLTTWTWSMDEAKALKLVRLLHLVATDKRLLQRDLAKLVGKLNFYMDIFSGRYFIKCFDINGNRIYSLTRTWSRLPGVWGLCAGSSGLARPGTCSWGSASGLQPFPRSCPPCTSESPSEFIT